MEANAKTKLHLPLKLTNMKQTEPIGFKGTKGEWSLGKLGNTYNDLNMCPIPYFELKSDESAGWIAHIANGWLINSDESTANRDLLAASKKMAIALQGLVGEITQPGYPLHSGMTIVWLDKCREALKEAGLND